MEGVGRGRGFLSLYLSPSVGRGSGKIPVASTPMPKLEGDVRSLDAQDIPPLDSVEDILQLEGLPRSESLQESDRDRNSVVSELIDQSAYDIRTDLPNSDHSLTDQLQTDCVDRPTVATVHNTVTPYAVEGSRGRIRSRAGRLFKPVSRLIEIMSQQKVSS